MSLEQELLKQLYQRYGKELHLYIYSLNKNWLQAEDILQETFLKAILSLSDQHTNMRAWLYKVARNLCFNAIKKDQRTQCSDQIQTLADVRMSEESLLNRLIREEKKQYLYRSVAKLEDKKREVLMMQYFGHLSQKEIAAILRITPENVRVLSYRARKDLKTYLEEDDYDLS